MVTVIMLGLLCYIYTVLLWGLLTFVVRHEGASLPVLFGVPALVTLALWLLGGPELLRLVAFYPIRLLAQVRYGLG